MATLTPNQVLLVGAIGGLAVLLGIVTFAAVGIGLYTSVCRLIDYRERRRVLREGRRQLRTFNTINDLKE